MNNHIKFSDDTIIWSLLHSDDEEISLFKSCCDSHHRILNTNKTKDIIPEGYGFFYNWAIKQVCSYKYLGVIMGEKIRWCEHVEFLCSKLDQSINFLRGLRLLGLNEKNMLFFHLVLESGIRCGLAAWNGTLTVQCKNKHSGKNCNENYTA